VTAVFEVEQLTRSFGGLRVTQSVSLALSPGDRVALIGPNGAGKTTFVNLVTGHLKPDSGTVRVAGEQLNGMNPMRRVQRGLAGAVRADERGDLAAQHIGARLA